MKIRLPILFMLVALSFAARAEWTKSYDWSDSKDQIWTAYVDGGKKYISTGGWEIEYSVANETDITITYVKTVGTSNLLNFDTIERDTGLRLVKIGAQKFKNKCSTLTDLVFPSSLAEIESEAFHSCPFDGDFVFPGRITLRNSAFYYTKAKTVTIKEPGSILDGAVFGGGSGWTGTSDITGVTSIGSGAFSRGGSSYPLFEVVISAAVTNIGNNAFSQQRGLTLTVVPPKLAAQIPDADGVIGQAAFKDVGESCSQGFTLTIPFRGGCTVGSQAFNWMVKCGNFEFWGKAPSFASDAFNAIGSDNSYMARITGCVEMDPVGWSALATPCTDAEKARSDYPGDDVCLGTYTSGSGCVFWVCAGSSPYTVSATEPILDGVSVVKTADGFRVAGSLIQGSANIKAVFGEYEFPVASGDLVAPADFEVTIPVGSEEGQLPRGAMYDVSVVATDESGGETTTWTSETAVYTGELAVEMVTAATEVHLQSGLFRVRRLNGDTGGELVVFYSVSGTAVPGTNYEPLSGTITIPDGSDSGDIVVVPLYDEENTQATKLVLTLADGNYFVSSPAASAEMIIASSDASEKDVYVDSAMAVSGDGSESSPLRTIPEGIARARAGFTIHVRGGEGREYVILGDADHILVPASKAGLTIRGWGDGKPLVSVTNKLDSAQTTDSPIVIEAPNVVLSGLSLTYSYDSLSELGYGKPNHPLVRFEETATSNVVEDCDVIRGVWSANADHNRYGTGQSGIFLELAPCSFRNCRFFSVRSENSVYQLAPIVLDDTRRDRSVPCEIAGCVFSNCTWIVNCKKGREPVTVISNVFLNCACEVDAASSNGNPTDGLFRGAANGPGSLLLAYNIFYNDETMEGKSKTVCQGCRETYNDGFTAHHNTVVGFDNFLSKSNLFGPNCPASIFDNLFVLNEGGFVCNEAWWFNATTNNVATSFKSDSFVRNNFVAGGAQVNGGTLTQYEGYGFTDNVMVTNNLSAPEPVFVSLNPQSPYFCCMKSNENKELTGKTVAWTGDGGEYPAYLGAVEPLSSDAAFILLFR